MSNVQTGKTMDIHINRVSTYLELYLEQGFEGLYTTMYRPCKSNMECHASSLIESITRHPVCSIYEAIAGIKELTGMERKPAPIGRHLP